MSGLTVTLGVLDRHNDYIECTIEQIEPGKIAVKDATFIVDEAVERGVDLFSIAQECLANGAVLDTKHTVTIICQPFSLSFAMFTLQHLLQIIDKWEAKNDKS